MKNKTQFFCFLLVILAFFSIIVTACNTQPTVQQATTKKPIATDTPQLQKRGTGGTLHLLYWESPTILNPHLTLAVKDWEASRLVYEPLATFDPTGTLTPVLALEIPSRDNEGLDKDGQWVQWKLKHNVKWSDGMPFTAKDVKFTFDFVTNPDVQASSFPNYANVKDVEVIDDYTVKVHFQEPTPAWSLPFVGMWGWIIPQHVFAPYHGANAREAPANRLPVGTGPYKVVSFQPQEILFLGSSLIETNKVVFEPNPYYRDEDKPFFSKVELRGGGTPDEAARLLFEDNDVDYVYNLTISNEKIKTYAAQPQGRIFPNFGSNVELIELNFTDPNRATADGERSSLEFPNPFFSDLRVRQAFAHAIDRDAIATFYGNLGRPATNILVAPPMFPAGDVSPYPFDLKKAAALLDEAGWVDTNGDGTRDKDGRPLQLLFRTGLNNVRSSILSKIQEDLRNIQVDVKLDYQDISVFYSNDPANNPGAAVRFLSDVHEWDVLSVNPEPGARMRLWTSSQIPQKKNNWKAGLNSARWSNKTYDSLYEQSMKELDPEKRNKLFLKMNDMLIEEVVVIPLVNLGRVSAAKSTLEGINLTPWDVDTWNIQDWRQSTP